MTDMNPLVARSRATAVRIAGRMGFTAYNLQLLASIRHPEWLYRSRSRVPRRKLTFRAAAPLVDADVALCHRLIVAYRAAAGSQVAAGQTSGIWGHLADLRQRDLANALERDDAAHLAYLLASMFRQDFVLGMATGSLFRDSSSRVGTRIWSLKTLDGLISLAEFLGVVRTENPEQGVIGHAFEGGSAEVVDGIEKRLGFSINFPNVGAAYGISLGERLITLDSPEQIYAAARLRDAIVLHLDNLSPDIVEIGAGYGGMAYWMLQAVPSIARYTIIDLPTVNMLQGYFLARALGSSSISFFGEPRARIAVLPPSSIQTLVEPFDVLVNKDSMPEIPSEAAAQYLTWAKSRCRGIFYSNNQEAYSPFDGVPQTLVPEAIARVGAFKRLRRDQSWVRRGYVEEVYTRS